ncbi:hypothetical protein [Homoserinimonas sp. OAct 916]|uniref:hypothetical protein n=1 Tax=Homoserinimonas sp. OAct 916 TaxID=2211450 RepID=UPI0013006AB7|nr:hypothetical protein [Homoserinimonas sp. OAct 916]
MTVWVTAADEAGLIVQIAVVIDRVTTGWRDAARKAIYSRLESLTLKLGVPNVIGVNATSRAAPGTVPTGSLEFEVIRAAASEDEHRGLVILIDEVQSSGA